MRAAWGRNYDVGAEGSDQGPSPQAGRCLVQADGALS